MPTKIASGSAAANKIFGAALFTESTKVNSMCNLLTDGAPKVVEDSKLDGRKQTSKGAPVVRIQDLGAKKGDEVTMDLYHQIGGLPVMGDDPVAGKEESLTSSQFTLKINQYRKAVTSGGKMTSQRTVHDLVRVANSMLTSYQSKLKDQILQIIAAGARGDVAPGANGGRGGDWFLPLAGSTLDKITVNPITPPTFDRHMYGGDATAIDNIDSADKFDLRVVNKVKLALDESNNPLQSVRFEGDEAAEDMPFYVWYITPRQWYDWQESTDANFGGQAFKRLQANALERAKLAKNHPIFNGSAVLYENMLIKKAPRPIVFNAGSQVSVCQNNADATVTTLVPGVKVNRSFILGAQGIADAWGMAGSEKKGGYHFTQKTEDRDYGNDKGHLIAWMNGLSKVRFRMSDGWIRDHGIMVCDTAVSG